jgi:lipopolysaccharide/colanic/teichoic acid biosynthesis glycosyltransferase
MSTANFEIGDVATTSMEWPSAVDRNDPRTDEVATMAALRNTGYGSIKPKLDRALAVAMLLIAGPIVLFFMFLTRMNSRGSWIYRQKRLGLGGNVFTIYKLRTMYQDSERDNIARWCVPGDPRVTPVGRFLRWSHIDELPQLINVLRGEMSLVGPRPERPEFLSQLERAFPDYRQRLTVWVDRVGAGAAAPRHRSFERPQQAELRPLLCGTDEFLD